VECANKKEGSFDLRVGQKNAVPTAIVFN